MKRSKKLLGLLAVLALFIVAAYIATVTNPENSSDSTTTSADIKYTILTIEPDMVETITWTYESQTLTFTHTEDMWSYADDSTFPLDETYIDSMLSSINGIQASKIIEDVTDLSMYGLDNPVCSISVDAGGAYQILIGNETALDGLRYVSIGDANVYLVDESLLTSFSYGLYDLLEKENIPTMSDIVNVSIASDTNSLSIEYKAESGLAYSDEYVWFLKDGDSYLTLDTELTDTLVGNITGLSFGECVNYNANDEELASYGLTSPMVTTTITYTEGEENKTFTLELGSYIDGNCYARIAESRMVYLVDGAISDALMYTGYTELQPDEVLIMNWDTVTKVVVSLDGTDYTFNKTSKPVIDENENVTEEIIYTLNGSEAEIESVLTTLTSLSSTGYSNGTTPELSAEISFVIYRDTESFAETVLTFYEYDSSSCLVSLNGETTVFVAREDIVAIIEAINAIVLG